jgi:uncharacterized hydantoinase/oxoprolinase family protein
MKRLTVLVVAGSHREFLEYVEYDAKYHSMGLPTHSKDIDPDFVNTIMTSEITLKYVFREEDVRGYENIVPFVEDAQGPNDAVVVVTGSWYAKSPLRDWAINMGAEWA